MPSRKFPGVLLQGDTLASLLALARESQKSLSIGDTQQAEDSLEQLEEALDDYVSYYEYILSKNKIELPYPNAQGRK